MSEWRTFIDPSVGDGQNTINGIIADGSTFGVGISSNLSVSGLSTFSNIARFSSTIRLDGQLRDGDNNFGSSGQVLSSDGTDTRWINAGDLAAGAASLVSVTNTTSGTGFLTFVDSTGGNEEIRTNTGIGYNIGTQVITGRISSIDNHNTGQLSEGSNLYFTQARARASLSGGTGLSYNSSTGQFSVQTLNQDTTGNAATATTLQTSRTIGGVSFNGSVNINLPGVNQTGNQNTSGNAGSATVLETTRNFSISGEITANAQSFNGSGNVTLSATVDDNVIDEANLKISNSPTNGRFLQCNTGVSGGLTWAEVTLPTSNTLSGTTLASGITASSITSLGTLTGLTVNGNVSVTGTVDGRDLSSDGSKLDGIDSGAKDDQTKAEIDALNINADQLDGQHGSYYRNAGNLNAGTIPDARLDDSSLFVTGMIMMYTGSSAPSGWAICNGSNGTPDLRNRFIVGAGSAYSVDDTGGAASVTLTTAQLPAHSHTTPNHNHSFSATTSSNTHNHTWDRQDAQNDQGYRPWPASNNDCVRTTANTGDNTHSHTVSGTTGNANPTTNTTGSGNSHENRPPYYALMFIMKL